MGPDVGQIQKPATEFRSLTWVSGAELSELSAMTQFLGSQIHKLVSQIKCRYFIVLCISLNSDLNHPVKCMPRVWSDFVNYKLCGKLIVSASQFGFITETCNWLNFPVELTQRMHALPPVSFHARFRKYVLPPRGLSKHWLSLSLHSSVYSQENC